MEFVTPTFVDPSRPEQRPSMSMRMPGSRVVRPDADDLRS
jgi:hypothetical protein